MFGDFHWIGVVVTVIAYIWLALYTYRWIRKEKFTGSAKDGMKFLAGGSVFALGLVLLASVADYVLS